MVGQKTTSQTTSRISVTAEGGGIAPESIPMGEVAALPLREIPVDLIPSDIEAIIAYVPLLPGRWRAKFARLSHDSGHVEPLWGYIFHIGPADDLLPMITISKTNATYTVVSWDVPAFLSEGVFGEYCSDTIADALATVRIIAVGPVGVQEGETAPLNGRNQELISKSIQADEALP